MEAEEALEAQAPGAGERGGFTGRRQKILYVKEAKEKNETSTQREEDDF